MNCPIDLNDNYVSIRRRLRNYLTFTFIKREKLQACTLSILFLVNAAICDILSRGLGRIEDCYNYNESES